MPVSMVIYLESIVCKVFNKLNYKLYLSGTDFSIACDSTFWWLCLKNNCVKHEEYDSSIPRQNTSLLFKEFLTIAGPKCREGRNITENRVQGENGIL